jgi:FAD/FMN-containing dehydrogenase/Fe-S oxidoreductase
VKAAALRLIGPYFHPEAPRATMNQHVPANHALAERLAREIEGEVLFDRFSRGRYATDASIYQIEPMGVVVPKTIQDVRIAAEIAREAGVPLLPRGGATSQSGQTVGRALVVDFAKHLTRVLEVDREAATCVVEPGIALDELNRQLKATGRFFPVDVSTSARATIGGMTGNNSCGTRSIRYGIMRDNVLEIDALLPDGTPARFGEIDAATFDKASGSFGALARDLVALGSREQDHIRGAFPGVSRRVGGYLIDALLPRNAPINLATLLCGSEGTLALSERVKLKLWPQAKNKALGICHFPTFRAAMEAPQHIVKLGPVAVEVVDRTLIELARDIAMFRPVMEAHVRGKPDALLLVEFAEDDQAENLRRLERLDELMSDLGFPGAVVKITNAAEQAAVWSVRAAGLNIMMSMKTEGKPVSFIEDCAVPLEHLADYTERLTAVFEKHGTKGTWYAHASVGCLHVRPVLNLKLEKDAQTMRAIAEEAFAMVKEYKGAHSGEHGDGLVRSEFHEMMYGRKTVEIFEEVKDRFDPAGIMNPGKIVRPPRMNDRTLFRYKPDYAVAEFQPALDWSAWPGAGGGFQGAVEMCNNNGECRKLAGAVMCPSYRVTMEEQHVTRGRANTLRLAISGQLGPGAFTSDEMMETLKLCVSCKACRRECPTGVDMARMKIEVLAARGRAHGVPLRERMIATLPRWARWASLFPPLVNARSWVPGLAKLMEGPTGIAAERPLPRFAWGAFHDAELRAPDGREREVILLPDAFNRYFEPDNLRAAIRVLRAAGYDPAVARPPRGMRPLDEGRTLLAAGLVDQARAEARRTVEALSVWSSPVVGIEPSSLTTLRDEFLALLPGEPARALAARAFLLSEFLDREKAQFALKPLPGEAHIHGHCHQKAFGAFPPALALLRRIPGLTVTPIVSSCCGMAGAFGYQAETLSASKAMAELSLLPAVRAAAPEAFIIADGTSCRHQIADLAGREAIHSVRLLERALA